MRTWLTGLLPVVLSACLFSACVGGVGPQGEAVDEVQILAFADRIEVFYRSLERIPLDVLMTYEDPDLRAHFADPSSFSDYYADLADQVREANFRNGRAESVEIRQFRFETPELARVDVELMGRHDRGLRFWQFGLPRTDTWRLIEGSWMLSPGKL